MKMVFPKIFLAFLYATCFSVALLAQPAKHVAHYLLGEKKVDVVEKCFGKCDSKVIFINVHDTERTNRVAADSFLQKQGGMIVHLVNNNNRNVSFKSGSHSFTFDPNRIFSKEGRMATLGSLSKNNSALAEPLVADFAEALLKKYVPK